MCGGESSYKDRIGKAFGRRKGRRKKVTAYLERNDMNNYRSGGNEVISNEKVASEVSLTNASFKDGTFSKKHFNKVFFMGTVLSLNWEKNMQSLLFPSRNIYSVKIMLSQFSGNLNYFPFVDYKVSRRCALMPIKVNGRFCINSPESWISLVLSCKAFKLCYF